MIRPEWKAVAALVVVICKLASPSGPSILYQERSIRWEAMFCPPLRKLVMLRRWIKGLKYPRDVEKFERVVCFVRMSVWVIFEISRARAMPRAVTIRAVILMDRGMVIGGVFVGMMNEVMRNPARMLPSARRVMGEVTAGLFSFTGVKGGIRTKPVCTSTVIRIVYTAVNDVARRVKIRAQVFR